LSNNNILFICIHKLTECFFFLIKYIQKHEIRCLKKDYFDRINQVLSFHSYCKLRIKLTFENQKFMCILHLITNYKENKLTKLLGSYPKHRSKNLLSLNQY